MTYYCAIILTSEIFFFNGGSKNLNNFPKVTWLIDLRFQRSRPPLEGDYEGMEIVLKVSHCFIPSVFINMLG